MARLSFMMAVWVLLSGCAALMHTETILGPKVRTPRSEAKRTVVVGPPALRAESIAVNGPRMSGRLSVSALCQDEVVRKVSVRRSTTQRWGQADEKGILGLSALGNSLFLATGVGLALCPGSNMTGGCDSSAQLSESQSGVAIALGVGAGLSFLVDVLYVASVSGDRVTQEEESSRSEPYGCKGSPMSAAEGRLEVGERSISIAILDGRFEALLDEPTIRALAAAEGSLKLEVAGRSTQLKVGPDALQALVAFAEDEQLRFPPALRLGVEFVDGAGDRASVLEGGESGRLLVRVENVGRGRASSVSVRLAASPALSASSVVEVGDLAPGEKKSAELSIEGAPTLKPGKVTLVLHSDEQRGFPAAPLELELMTDRRRAPRLVFGGLRVLDGEEGQQAGNGNGRIEAGEQVELAGIVRNVGDGGLRSAEASMIAASPGVSSSGQPIPLELEAGRQRELRFTVAFPANPPPPRKGLLTLSVKQGERLQLSHPLELEVLPRDGTQRVVVAAAANREAPARSELDALLAVFPLRFSNGVAKRLAHPEALYELYTARMNELGLRLVPASEVRQKLSEAKLESYRECYDEACQLELGKALAASAVVRTAISELGKQCSVTASVFDLKSETAIKSAARRTACAAESLGDALDSIALQLAR